MPGESYNTYGPGGVFVVDLVDAIAEFGSQEITLIIRNQQYIDANLTIPDNITLEFARGGFLSVATGVTVTMGAPIAGRYQIFCLTGTGKVVLPGPAYAEWWGAAGDGVTDDTAAIQGAIDAVTGGDIYIYSPSYVSSLAIRLKTGIHIWGSSINDTELIVDHSATSHGPAFIWNGATATADLINWSIKNLRIIFDGCGTPSTESGDVGIQLLKHPSYTHVPYLYEITNVRVGNAYWAYWDDTGGFHGRIDRFWSNMSRNGIYKKTGTTMVLENIEVGGRKTTADGTAYYLENIVGLSMNQCVVETWMNNDIAYFKDLRQSTLADIYLEDVSTLLTGTNEKHLVVFDHCDGLNLLGITFWGADVVVADSQNAELVYILHGHGNILGTKILAAPGTLAFNQALPTTAPGSAGSWVHTIAFNEAARFNLLGCYIEKPKAGTSYGGGRNAIKNYDNTSNILIAASYVENVSDDYTQIAHLNTNLSQIRIPKIPTAAGGLSAGDIWSDGGTLKIV